LPKRKKDAFPKFHKGFRGCQAPPRAALRDLRGFHLETLKPGNFMTLRSMTGFAQVKGQVNAQLAFALSLKSVNHRFLDLHFRLPSDTDALEMKLRRILKEKMARGHVEVILNLDRSGTNGVALNRQLIAGYVQAFRAAADEFGVEGRARSERGSEDAGRDGFGRREIGRRTGEPR
jgi:hypothetical protein